MAFLPDKRRLRGSWLGEVDEGEDAECVSSNPLKAFCLLGWVNSLCARGIMHSFMHIYTLPKHRVKALEVKQS